MGYRLHYASKYDVQYKGGFFNHNTELVNELLNNLVELVSGHLWYNGEELYYSNTLEIDKAYFLDIIKYLKGEYLFKDEELLYYEETLLHMEESIDKSLIALDYTREKFIEILQSIYDNSAPEINYIRLEWY